MTDLAPDVVELAAWTPAAAVAAAPLREVAFRANSWLPEELDELRKRFRADEPIAAIAAALGRGAPGVADKLGQLGLRRNSALPWSESEDAEVLRRYGEEAAAAIALSLGRAVTAVYQRAASLGCTRVAEPHWTEWEDLQLRTGYAQGVPIVQLGQLIGRSAFATNTRAHKLGLRHASHPPEWSAEECARALELAEEGLQYPVIRRMLHAEGFPLRTKPSFDPKIRKLGYGRGWGRPWTTDEDLVLREAYAAGDSLTPLQTRLGRDRWSINSRANVLGLNGTHAGSKAGWRLGPVWSEGDERRLREGYGKVPTRQLAAELGRDLRAIYTRANNLGLEHPWIRAFTEADARLVQVAWRHGVSLSEVSAAVGRDPAVVAKFAMRQGYAFNARDRPVQPTHGRRTTPRLTSADQILALADPDEPFIPVVERPRGTYPRKRQRNA